MEVVGFIAAIGSIAKAGDAAVTFGTKIYKAAREAPTVGRRIRRTSLYFRTFGKVIKATEMSLKLRFDGLAVDSESEAVQYMQKNHLLEELQLLSAVIIEDIRIQIPENWSIKSRLGSFMTSWKWTQLEEEIMRLHPRMESLKSTLQLMSTIVSIEIVAEKNKARPSEEYEREIAFLRRQIDEQTDTIRHLKRSCQKLQISIYPTTQTSGRSSTPHADPLRVICHLGQSIIETGTVPTQPPETFSFREARKRGQYRRRHDSDPVASQSSNNPTHNTREAQSRAGSLAHTTSSRSTTPNLSPSITPGNNDNTYTIPRHPTHPSVEAIQTSSSMISSVTSQKPQPETPRRRSKSPRQLPVVVSVKEVLEEDDEDSSPTDNNKPDLKIKRPATATPVIETDDPSRNKSRELKPHNETIQEIQGLGVDPDTTEQRKQHESPPAQPPPVQIQTEPTPPPTPTSQTSPISLRRIHPTVPERRPRRTSTAPDDSPLNTQYTTETGYLVAKNGTKQLFEAHVDSRQTSMNLITMDYVKKLGLHGTGLYHMRRSRTLSYQDRELDVIGRVTFMWSTLPGDSLIEPSSVEVIICQELPYPLIFGKWFTAARRNFSRMEAEVEAEVIDWPSGE